ncbi:MAG: hypothetical protein WBW88_19030 [Rhodothermales bacterium]
MIRKTPELDVSTGRTVSLLGTVVNDVEDIKEDSLTSEGYALMKYNIEHALRCLPGRDSGQ